MLLHLEPIALPLSAERQNDRATSRRVVIGVVEGYEIILVIPFGSGRERAEDKFTVEVEHANLLMVQ